MASSVFLENRETDLVSTMAGQSTTDCFSDGQFSLGTFDAIVLTDSSDLSADGLGVSSEAAFPSSELNS